MSSSHGAVRVRTEGQASGDISHDEANPLGTLEPEVSQKETDATGRGWW